MRGALVVTLFSLFLALLGLYWGTRVQAPAGSDTAERTSNVADRTDASSTEDAESRRIALTVDEATQRDKKIEVLVRDRESGSGIADAVLEVNGAMVARTDRQGMAHLVNVHRPATVEASAPGFMSGVRTVREGEASPIVLVLVKARRVDLTIEDSVSMIGIDGAVVHNESGEKIGVSTSRGVIEIDLPFGEESIVDVTHPDYVPVEAKIADQAERVVVELQKWARVRFRVATDGEDGPSWSRLLYSVTERGVWETGSIAVRPKASAFGETLVGASERRVVPRRAVTLHVGVEGYCSRRVGPLLLNAGDELDLGVVALARGGAVFGRVTSLGEPVRGGEVVISSEQGQIWSSTLRADGTYEVDGVEAGPLLVRLKTDIASADATACARRVVVREGARHRVDFDVSSGSSLIHGLVTREDGTPMPDHPVQAVAGMTGGDERAFGAVCRSDGTFVIPVDQGVAQYEVRAWHGTGFVSVGNVQPGGDVVHLVLPIERELNIVLLNENGRPVLDLPSHARWLARSGQQAGFEMIEARLVRGVARVAVDAPRGQIWVDLQAKGYVPQEVEYSIGIRSASASIEVTLEFGEQVSLRLVGGEAARRIASKAAVFLLRSDQLSWIGHGLGVEGMRINGVSLPQLDLRAVGRAVRWARDGTATVRGLTLGDYHLVTFPEDVAIRPGRIRVPSQGVINVDITK